jgi:hypothetical protein
MTQGWRPFPAIWSLQLSERPPGIRSALEGTTVKVINNHLRGLSQLWVEFRFQGFSAQLSQCRESGDFTEDPVSLSALKKRILAMEEEMHHGNREIASPRREFATREGK